MSAKDGRLALDGLSLDAEIVAAFLTGLEESSLSRVELLETKLEQTEGLKLSSFRIQARYPDVKPLLEDPAGPAPTTRRGH